MYPLLIDYVNRFKTEHKPGYFKFFTQLSLGEHITGLPYLFNIEKFCLRLLKAKQDNQKICIYSDYDTDAVTATATMYWGLISLGFKQENLDFYAPDRFTEGYGMNIEAIEKLAKQFDLIISVDCGINSVKEAEAVRNLKIENSQKIADLIITDHHHLHSQIPGCVAVINPRLGPYYLENQEKFEFLKTTDTVDENIINYLNDHNKLIKNQLDIETILLSESVTGVGVAWFCLVWLGYFLAQIQEIPLDAVKSLNRLLPLTAIGTIADCQSILEPTNRLLVRSGLKIIQDNTHNLKGLKEILKQTELLEKMQFGYQITSQDLGFILSPILNSSGRLSHANLSIQCLIDTENQANNQKLVQELIQTNQDRKQMVKDILSEVETQAEDQFISGHRVLWLEGDWSKGIIGLLASRLVNMYNLPVVVVSISQEESQEDVSASLRAPEGYHIPKAMEQLKQLFDKSGGHPGAAGFTANQANLSQIKEKLSLIISEQFENIKYQNEGVPRWLESQQELINLLPKNLERLKSQKNLIWLSSTEITHTFLSEIFNLDPFGQDFPMPSLVFSLDFTDQPYQWLGKENKHIKIKLYENINLTAFNIDSPIKELLISNNLQKTWVQAKLSQNTWNGSTKIELIVNNLWI